MLINFRMKNVFCFNEETILSLEKTKWNELKSKNITEKFDLLKSIVVFWANASGKSRLFKVINRFSIMICESWNEKLDLNNFFQHFKLEEGKEKKPIELWCEFIIDDIKYSYEYSIYDQKIVYEKLSYYPKWKITKLFIRKENKDVVFNERIFDKQSKLVKDTSWFRENTLFLSAVANADGEISKKIQNFFLENCNVLDGVSFWRTGFWINLTAEKMNNDQVMREKVNNFIKYLDTWISSIEIEEEQREQPEFIKKEFLSKFNFDKKIYIPKTNHLIYKKNKEVVNKKMTFDLWADESEGTKQLFALAYPIIDTLEKGKVLFIDEFNTMLHPNISKFLIELFNSSKYNKKNAQLIINTHDTNLLNLELFRRDQIYFTEKNKYGESELFSLADINGIRAEDPNIEKKYLSGSFGAIPNIEECDLFTIMNNG